MKKKKKKKKHLDVHDGAHNLDVQDVRTRLRCGARQHPVHRPAVNIINTLMI
jgi:hypothetical protein